MHPIVIMTVPTREQTIEFAGATASRVDVDENPSSKLMRKVGSARLKFLRYMYAGEPPEMVIIFIRFLTSSRMVSW